MFKERNDTGSGTDQLLRRNVHVLNRFAGMLTGFTHVTAHDHRTDKAVFFIQKSICLSNNELLFFISGQVINRVRNLSVNHAAVGRFNETVLVDNGVK